MRAGFGLWGGGEDRAGAHGGPEHPASPAASPALPLAALELRGGVLNGLKPHPTTPVAPYGNAPPLMPWQCRFSTPLGPQQGHIRLGTLFPAPLGSQVHVRQSQRADLKDTPSREEPGRESHGKAGLGQPGGPEGGTEGGTERGGSPQPRTPRPPVPSQSLRLLCPSALPVPKGDNLLPSPEKEAPSVL